MLQLTTTCAHKCRGVLLTMSVVGKQSNQSVEWTMFLARLASPRLDLASFANVTELCLDVGRVLKATRPQSHMMRSQYYIYSGNL